MFMYLFIIGFLQNPNPRFTCRNMIARYFPFLIYVNSYVLMLFFILTTCDSFIRLTAHCQHRA